jgi:hypothetical protein
MSFNKELAGVITGSNFFSSSTSINLGDDICSLWLSNGSLALTIFSSGFSISSASITSSISESSSSSAFFSHINELFID